MAQDSSSKPPTSDKWDHKNLPSYFIGLNTLEKAESGPVKDFVQSHNGHTVITNVCSYSFIITIYNNISQNTNF